jgi:hypothetical protein
MNKNEESAMTQAIQTQAIRAGGGTRLFRPLMYGLILASAAAQFALVPVMPVYAHRFGLSGFQQGMVLGATGLATGAASAWAPRWGCSTASGPRRRSSARSPPASPPSTSATARPSA